MIASRAVARFPRASFPSEPHPRLGRLLWQWLALGVLLLALLPVTREQHAWLGSGPFWLLVAPLSSLLVFNRHAIAAAWRAACVEKRSLQRGRASLAASRLRASDARFPVAPSRRSPGRRQAAA